MNTDFDSRVTARQHHTPWASIRVEQLLSSLTLFGDASTTLIVTPRPQVSSHLWWTLTWTDATGKRQHIAAATCDLLLWQAAEVELAARTAISSPLHSTRQAATEATSQHTHEQEERR